MGMQPASKHDLTVLANRAFMLLAVVEITMRAGVTNHLAALLRMSKPQLLADWKELFQVTPQRKMRRDLLVRLLSYRVQERAFGELSPTLRRRLADLARKLDANPNAVIANAPSIKSGTRLIRDWRGQSHRVTVLESGYEYAGKRYSSLSRIARLITGTRWSGPLFFGLREKKSQENLRGQ